MNYTNRIDTQIDRSGYIISINRKTIDGIVLLTVIAQIFSTTNKLCYYQSPFRVWLSVLALLLLSLSLSALWTS